MEHFTVTPPAILKKIFGSMMAFGLAFAAIMWYFAYHNVANASIGHVILGLVFFVIGFVVYAYAVRWKIEVKGNELSVHYLLKPTKKIPVSNITQIIIGGRMQLTMIAGGKKLAVVDYLCDNYEKLAEYFRLHGIKMRKL